MEEKAADLITPTKISASGEVQEEDIKANPGSARVNTCSTPVSTHSIVQKVNVIVSSPVKEAMRLQALQDEEASRQVHLDALLAKRILKEQELSEQQKKRKSEVQEAAQHYSEEDWDNIRAKLKANAELVKDVQGENVTSIDFAKRMVEMINQKKKYYAE
ncbi:hypothetical protein Tco_1015223 [Tanacetum coccineum]|uniref:Clathrin light chain n=1 Tax=Tanacetum coccineum TaxID=301880 RepID=A0ABQ5FL94_9ASTR